MVSLQRWAKNKAAWQEALPLCPHNSDLGSWLFFKKHPDGTCGLGCKACFLQGRTSEYGKATVVTKRNFLEQFRQHHVCEAHRQAVIELTRCEHCKGDLQSLQDSRTAPSFSDFRRVWDARVSGGPCHKIRGVCGRGKRQMMEFCCAEAMRMTDREFLESAVAMCTHIDSKKHRLTMRFSAANDNLSVRKGLIGHVVHAGEHKDSVKCYVDAVDSLLRKFCTWSFGAPAHPVRPRLPPAFDQALYDKLRSIHEVFNADAAQTMVLTGMEVSNHHGQAPRTLFQNNRLVLKDVTHRARRTVL